MKEFQFQRYIKTFVAIVTTALIAVQVALTGDDTISQSEWITIALAGLGAVGVYVFPNKTDTPAPDLSVQDPKE